MTASCRGVVTSVPMTHYVPCLMTRTCSYVRLSLARGLFVASGASSSESSSSSLLSLPGSASCLGGAELAILSPNPNCLTSLEAKRAYLRNVFGGITSPEPDSSTTR